MDMVEKAREAIMLAEQTDKVIIERLNFGISPNYGITDAKVQAMVGNFASEAREYSLCWDQKQERFDVIKVLCKEKRGLWNKFVKAYNQFKIQRMTKEGVFALLIKANRRRKAESKRWKVKTLKYKQELLAERERHGKDYIDSVWHSKDERPCGDDYVLVSDGTGFMAEPRIGQMQPHHRWAYLKDLLPHIAPPVLPRSGRFNEDACTKDRNEW